MNNLRLENFAVDLDKVEMIKIEFYQNDRGNLISPTLEFHTGTNCHIYAKYYPCEDSEKDAGAKECKNDYLMALDRWEKRNVRE